MCIRDRYKETGIPPVRALVMDYTDDPETYEIDNEYLFGEDLLVAPMAVEEEMRRVYLPAGEWADYWTGEIVSYGWHEVETDHIPVYQRRRTAYGLSLIHIYQGYLIMHICCNEKKTFI